MQQGGRELSRIAQVVPDLPTFAVDDGFSYSVPDEMQIEVGSIVRVPLGGRRIRGWVTGLRSGSHEGLKGVIGVSGAKPIFNADLLQTLRWAAIHYVSPLAAVLPRSGPPNLPKVARVKLDEVPDVESVQGHLGVVAQHLDEGRRPATLYVAGSGPWQSRIAALLHAAAKNGASTLIVVPTAVECHSLAERLEVQFGNRVVAGTSSAPAADRTRAWSQATRNEGMIVVGTAEAALWPIAGLGLAMIVEEGRRAMKARQTPTLHVRELLRRRSAVERFGLVMVGHQPSLEVLAAGTKVEVEGSRAWPLVEVIDRTEEPPSSGLLADGVSRAIAAVLRAGDPGFVFVSRRGYAPASRCSTCGEMRRCAECGSNPGRGSRCERCDAENQPCTNCGGASFAPVGAAVGRVIEELKRVHGNQVTAVGEGGKLQVGTERDIPPPATAALAVVVDIDSMLLRPHYRAEEDTLRVVARVASVVRRGRGHRCVVQSRLPDHRVLQALRHGHGIDIAAEWMAEREAEQLPPYGEIVAVELTAAPDSADAELRSAVGSGVAVFGPAETSGRLRWLLQAPDLRKAKVQLRERVQSWRDRGAKVRVNADPLDV